MVKKEARKELLKDLKKADENQTSKEKEPAPPKRGGKKKKVDR